MLFPERGVHVSASFFLLAALALIVSPWEIAASVLLAALLHECGHLLALKAFRVPVEGLRLTALGAELYARGARRLSYARELVVTLAGCGVNLACGFLIALAARRLSWKGGFLFAGAHFLLAAFNLLPIPPLDGGRFVVEVFQKGTRKMVSQKAMNYMSLAGMALFLGFFVIMLNQDIQRFVFGNWG